MTRRRHRWRSGCVGLGVAVVIGALGFPLGWLWSNVAPWLPVQVSGNELFYADPEGEQRAGAESWFILLSLGTGILLAVIVWFALRRFRGSIMVAALAIGSVATGWIAWWFGHNLGRTHALDVARTAKDGAILQFPPDLRIKSPGNVAHWHHLPYLGGVILYVALAAVAVYAILVGFSMSPSLIGRGRRPVPAPPHPNPTRNPKPKVDHSRTVDARRHVAPPVQRASALSAQPPRQGRFAPHRGME